jgi:hypothetical protein
MLNLSMIGTVVGAPASRICVDGTLCASAEVQAISGNGERLMIHVYSMMPRIATSLLKLTHGESVSVRGAFIADVVLHEKRRFGLALAVDAVSISSLDYREDHHGDSSA